MHLPALVPELTPAPTLVYIAYIADKFRVPQTFPKEWNTLESSLRNSSHIISIKTGLKGNLVGYLN